MVKFHKQGFEAGIDSGTFNKDTNINTHDPLISVKKINKVYLNEDGN